MLRFAGGFRKRLAHAEEPSRQRERSDHPAEHDGIGARCPQLLDGLQIHRRPSSSRCAGTGELFDARQVRHEAAGDRWDLPVVHLDRCTEFFGLDAQVHGGHDEGSREPFVERQFRGDLVLGIGDHTADGGAGECGSGKCKHRHGEPVRGEYDTL